MQFIIQLLTIATSIFAQSHPDLQNALQERYNNIQQLVKLLLEQWAFFQNIYHTQKTITGNDTGNEQKLFTRQVSDDFTIYTPTSPKDGKNIFTEETTEVPIQLLIDAMNPAGDVNLLATINEDPLE